MRVNVYAHWMLPEHERAADPQQSTAPDDTTFYADVSSPDPPRTRVTSTASGAEPREDRRRMPLELIPWTSPTIHEEQSAVRAGWRTVDAILSRGRAEALASCIDSARAELQAARCSSTGEKTEAVSRCARILACMESFDRPGADALASLLATAREEGRAEGWSSAVAFVRAMPEGYLRPVNIVFEMTDGLTTYGQNKSPIGATELTSLLAAARRPLEECIAELTQERDDWRLLAEVREKSYERDTRTLLDVLEKHNALRADVARLTTERDNWKRLYGERNVDARTAEDARDAAREALRQTDAAVAQREREAAAKALEDLRDSTPRFVLPSGTRTVPESALDEAIAALRNPQVAAPDSK